MIKIDPNVLGRTVWFYYRRRTTIKETCGTCLGDTDFLITYPCGLTDRCKTCEGSGVEETHYKNRLLTHGQVISMYYDITYPKGLITVEMSDGTLTADMCCDVLFHQPWEADKYEADNFS